MCSALLWNLASPEHASVLLCTSVHNMSSAYWQKGYHRCRLPYLQLLSWRPTLVRCSPAIDPAIDDLQQLYLVIYLHFRDSWPYANKQLVAIRTTGHCSEPRQSVGWLWHQNNAQLASP